MEETCLAMATSYGKRLACDLILAHFGEIVQVRCDFFFEDFSLVERQVCCNFLLFRSLKSVVH